MSNRWGFAMKRKPYSVEQVVTILKQAEGMHPCGGDHL
jgi:hypothetical protein